MASDTMTKTSGWRVELQAPVAFNNTTIEAIDIRPMRLDDVLKWGDDTIRSTLGLLEALSGIPEEALRLLQYPDADRVLVALASIMPAVIRDDFQNGRKPLATPADTPPMPDALLDGFGDEGLPAPAADGQLFENDPVDPRFPKASGPVKRIVEPEPKPEAPEDVLAGITPMRSVGQRVG